MPRHPFVFPGRGGPIFSKDTNVNRYQDLENRIRKTGAEIHASSEGEPPSLFDTGTWLGRVMEGAMKDEVFKFQLFRYVDLLPSLRTDALVVRLLKEYFTEEVNTPPIARKGSELLMFVSPFMNKYMQRASFCNRVA